MGKGMMWLAPVALLMVSGAGAQAQSCKGKVSETIAVGSGPEGFHESALFAKVKNETGKTLSLRIEFRNFHPARTGSSKVTLKKDENWSGMIGPGSDPAKSAGIFAVDARRATTKPYLYIHSCVVESK